MTDPTDTTTHRLVAHEHPLPSLGRRPYRERLPVPRLDVVDVDADEHVPA